MILSTTTAADTATVVSAWVAGAAAVIAIVAVGVAIRQAGSARDQATSAEKQVAIATSQAESARAQSDSAKRQADAAVAQTELQQRALHDAQQPYIWADFRLDETQGAFMHLVVRNEGPTVARDVRVVIDPPLQGAGLTRPLDSVHAQLAEGLRSMPPGREMKWGFAIGHLLYDEENELPRHYSVTISARGPYGDLPTLTYPLDLEEMREQAAPRLGTLEDVKKAIEKLTQVQAASAKGTGTAT